ncbi:MAG TPA: AAA family ATPase, partial [Solirubrobacteraceae bacterium]|nr:AAA family ATPase [Solirubrobacteraceae bacterium]
MRLDFVGRAGELEVLEGAWLAAGAGGVAPVVVVYGEAGIGKTRTTAEFARGVRSQGGEVLWGTCYEGGPARPYAVWAEAIRELVVRLEADGLRAVLGAQMRWLGPLLPDAERWRTSTPAEIARLRLAEVLARLLRSFERSPVLVLDDMQWAYPESLELFAQVARLARDVVVVVCCRASGLSLGHPLAQRLAEIHRSRSSEYLALAGLSRHEASELLERVAGGGLEPELVDFAYAETDGNPFFLAELGRYLYREGVGTLPPHGALRLPASIRGAVGL